MGFLRVKMCLVLLRASLLLVSAGTAQTANNWKPVQDAMGRPGTGMGEVLRFAMPRKDLHVTVRGTAINPGLALGSRAAFKKMDKEAMLMGDLVLTEQEIEPVMRKL